MSANTKIVAFTALALLTVAGGVYALGSGQAETAPASENSANMVVAVAPEKVADKPASPAPADSAKATGAVTTEQPVAMDQQPQGAPVKMTKKQLTPPESKTEAEKLQKAAEQEYNRF
jgi:hypothetical protein